MTLADLQANFQDYLLADEVGASAKPFLAKMVDDEAVGIEKRLNIYHHAYRARIQEALGTVYPNVHQHLGCQAFNQIITAYIAKYPSTYRNLRWVGDTLADYLAEVVPEQFFVADLARFEWALSLAFDAEDQPTLTIEDLGQIPPEDWSDLSFDWHPAVRIKTAQTQVIPAWQALDAGQAPQVIEDATTYVVWRQEMMSYFKTLDEREKLAIEFMHKGHTFGELCEALVGITGEEQVMTIAAGYLSEWLSAGMLLKSSLD